MEYTANFTKEFSISANSWNCFEIVKTYGKMIKIYGENKVLLP